MQVYTATERRLVLVASCMAIFVNPLIGSMLNLALNAIGSDLHCSAHQLGWIASIFFISSVATMVPAARLADIIGKRKVFVAGAVIADFGEVAEIVIFIVIYYAIFFVLNENIFLYA